MTRNASVWRVHALVIIPGPLRPRRVQEEAHVFRNTAVDVRITGTRRRCRFQRALCRTRGRAGPRGLVPPSHGFISHLHNHQFRLFTRNTNTRTKIFYFFDDGDK